MDIHEFIDFSVKQNASDLHFCIDHPPVIRTEGELHFCQTWPPVSPQWMKNLSQKLLNEDQRLSLQQDGQIDFTCQLGSNIRLRGHFFHQQHGLSVAFRLLSADCPTLTSLHAPEIIHTLIMQENGLILVTGATGSGKSTTLAAMINALMAASL